MLPRVLSTSLNCLVNFLYNLQFRDIQVRRSEPFKVREIEFNQRYKHGLVFCFLRVESFPHQNPFEKFGFHQNICFTVSFD